MDGEKSPSKKDAEISSTAISEEGASVTFYLRHAGRVGLMYVSSHLLNLALTLNINLNLNLTLTVTPTLTLTLTHTLGTYSGPELTSVTRWGFSSCLQVMGVCVCVCVCERESEREREGFELAFECE